MYEEALARGSVIGAPLSRDAPDRTCIACRLSAGFDPAASGRLTFKSRADHGLPGNCVLCMSVVGVRQTFPVRFERCGFAVKDSEM